MADVAKVVTIIGSSPESFAKARRRRSSGGGQDAPRHHRSRRRLDERRRRRRQDRHVPDDGQHRVRHRAQLAARPENFSGPRRASPAADRRSERARFLRRFVVLSGRGVMRDQHRHSHEEDDRDCEDDRQLPHDQHPYQPDQAPLPRTRRFAQRLKLLSAPAQLHRKLPIAFSWMWLQPLQPDTA